MLEYVSERECLLALRACFWLSEVYLALGRGWGALSHGLLFVGGPVGSPHGIVFCHQGTSRCSPISEPDLSARSRYMPGTPHKKGAPEDHRPLPSACWVLPSPAEAFWEERQAVLGLEPAERWTGIR